MEPEGNPRSIIINNPVEVLNSILETVERGVRKLDCRSGEIYRIEHKEKDYGTEIRRIVQALVKRYGVCVI